MVACGPESMLPIVPWFVNLLHRWRQVFRNPRETGRQRRGRIGEEAARAYLRKECGYRIIDRNWSFRERSQQGEIDLVALDGETLVFVEVRSRHSRDPRRPVDSVNRRKRQNLRRAFTRYLRRIPRRRRPATVRFDVIAVRLDSSDAVTELIHHRKIPIFGKWFVP